MARIARPLTALAVERLDTPGLHAVGTVPGLCLRIPPPPSTAKSWALRLVVNGKRRELGRTDIRTSVWRRRWLRRGSGACSNSGPRFAVT